MLRHAAVAHPAKAAATLLADGWVVRGRSFVIRPPIDWAADPFGDRNWRYQLSAMYFLVPFLQADEETCDGDALAFARRVMTDWVDFHLVRRQRNDFCWYDQATGMRAALLASVLDRSLRRDDVPAEELAPLVRAAREHLRRLADPAELATNNHALFQLGGLAGLARALPELPGADAARTYAAAEFGRIVASQFTADGVHTENSPFYHGYALQAIATVTDTGWLDVPADATARLARAWDNLRWFVRPDGLYAAIGDSHGGPSRMQRDRLRSLGQPVPAGAFAAGGYAVVRATGADGPASDGYLFLTAAYHSRAHKHRDALSFEWIDRGGPVLVDAGVYGTNRDARRDYALSTRAHNTVEVDGGDVDRGPPRAPALLGTARCGALHALAAEVEHPELAVRHRRILLYQPGAWLLVHDELAADRDRTFTAWFHPAPSAAPSLHDLVGGAAVTRARGETVPRLQGWVTTAYGQLGPADAIGFTRSARQVTFATLALLDAPLAAPELLTRGPPFADEIELRWRLDDTVRGARVEVRDGAISLTAQGSE